MSNIYKTVVTNEGAALIAQSVISGERLLITEAAVGDGGGAYYLPQASQTALVRECRRIAIAGAYLNADAPNVMDIEISIPPTGAAFTAREVGVFTGDGTLVAVGNLPDTAHPGAGAFGRLSVVMHIAVEDASALDVLVMPQSGAVSGFDFEAPVSSWQTRSGVSQGYAYVCEVTRASVGADMLPHVVIKEESVSAAEAAGICPAAETFDGGIRLYSQSVPASVIKARCYLICGGLSAGAS